MVGSYSTRLNYQHYCYDKCASGKCNFNAKSFILIKFFCNKKRIAGIVHFHKEKLFKLKIHDIFHLFRSLSQLSLQDSALNAQFFITKETYRLQNDFVSIGL